MNIALITGWGFSQGVWPIEVLKSKGHQVTVLDLITAPHTHLADSERNAFDYLIGWSLGGVIALEWALFCRAKVILLSSLPIMVQRADFPSGISASAFAEFTDFFQRDSSGAMQHFAQLVSLGSMSPRTTQKQLSPHLLSHPSDLQALRLADASVAWRVLQHQRRLQAVYAQQDVLLTAVSVKQSLALLPAVPVVWVQGCHAQCVLECEHWMTLL